jgi:GNAT superfamily N-acetyltransferase
MFTIRPFAYTDADYEAAVRIVSAVYPDQPESVQEWQHGDQTRDPQFLFARYLVELDGRIVATGIYCQPWWSHKPGKYFVNLLVDPDYQGRGIGTQFYDFLMGHVLAREPEVVTAGTREDKPASIHFLTRRGYRQVQREPISELEVRQFDPQPFAEIPPRVAGQGIVIKSLEELAAQEPDWKHKLWQLQGDLFLDVPGPDPITIDSFEVYQERELGSPNFRIDGQFIALDGDHWVGMTALWTTEADREKLFTGLTGVRREYRRRGIATALKLRAIDFAKRYGAKTIETGNDEGNPMYQINLRLGFRPLPAWLTFEKQFAMPADGQEEEQTR